MKRGDIISGYELVAQIAEGGMGTIWRARHPHLERQVALKFIRADVRDDSSVREAFVREVKNLSRLHSPHIVQVTDSGFTDDGSPFMVTEYLEGEDLRARLERERKLSIRDTLSIGIDVLKALSEAHALGLVHRDLKPGNIFLQQLAGGQAEAIKVLDFGVAKLIGQGSEGMLMPSMGAKGSPRFMAPEQIVGDPITPATDMYSFGATLYRMLTGEHLFGGNPVQVLQRHIDTEPVPLREMDPDGGFDEEIEDIVMICLRKDPLERPSSASALKTRLELVYSRIQTHSADEARSAGQSEEDEALESHVERSDELPAWLESTSQQGKSLAPELMLAPDETADKHGDLELDWAAVEPDRRKTVPEHDIPAGVFESASPSNEDVGDQTINELPPARPNSDPAEFDRSRTIEDSEPVAMLTALRSSNSLLEQPGETLGNTADQPKAITAPIGLEERRSSNEPGLAHFISKVPVGQRFAGGAAILLVAALIAFMLDDGEPKNVRSVIPVEVDADLAKWLEKEALRIRKETSTQKSAPTVVRHFERNPDPVKEFVEVTVAQGPAQFSVADTGAVLCASAHLCRVPIDKAIRVSRPGFRTQRLKTDDLYDRRNGKWRVILRR